MNAAPAEEQRRGVAVGEGAGVCGGIRRPPWTQNDTGCKGTMGLTADHPMRKASRAPKQSAREGDPAHGGRDSGSALPRAHP
jgi:hypothetical protein